MDAGAQFGITPYGTETMHVLRAEKGYIIVGQDTDGTVTPHDLGMAWVVRRRRTSSAGARSARRTRGPTASSSSACCPTTRESCRRARRSSSDAERRASPVPMLGHVTSSYYSAALGLPFALALVTGGRERIGETRPLGHGGRWVSATVRDPVLYDPEGARRDG